MGVGNWLEGAQVMKISVSWNGKWVTWVYNEVHQMVCLVPLHFNTQDFTTIKIKTEMLWPPAQNQLNPNLYEEGLWNLSAIEEKCWSRLIPVLSSVSSDQRLANFPYKEPISKYFRLYGSYDLDWNLSTRPWKSTHRSYVNKWEWLGAN